MPGAGLGLCTLIFGENGWGKSTLADLWRSLATNNPAILIGRKTLAGGPDQKAVLRIDDQQAIFENQAWTGPRPRMAIYDSVFINQNVFSGDVVSADHLKNQYGLVVGEEGVARVRQIVELDDENTKLNGDIRNAEAQLNAILRTIAPPAMKLNDFLALEERDEIDASITAKDNDVQRVRRAAEIKAAAEPQPFPLPTNVDALAALLGRSIDEIAEDALAAVRTHIEAHDCAGQAIETAHESWIEAGVPFVVTDNCPFCGQPLTDRTLVDAYKDFFSDAYKALGNDIRTARGTFARYANGEFRTAIAELAARNAVQFTYWQEAAKINPPALPEPNALVTTMEEVARLLDVIFQAKQADLTRAIAGSESQAALAAWREGRAAIMALNDELTKYLNTVKALKDSIDPSRLPGLETELKALQAIKRRHEPDVAENAAGIAAAKIRKEKIVELKTKLRNELNEYGAAITAELGMLINSYLGRLNAGFEIDYQKPDYRGKEPAASYQILINKQPVPPRTNADAVDQPTFKNTLSGGDKSTLALALFLAKVNADPALGETIVVLDDPFTSLDDFRRQFTANEIRKLCGRAAQTIVLSHDKNFLRLLWEKIDQALISCLSLQTGGAPGLVTIAPYDIAAATRERHVTERMKIEGFLEGEEHEADYIRTRLRTVCEDFYRRGDPELFGEAAALDEIIRRLREAPADYQYKGALDDLIAINEYSRPDSHAAVPGNPQESSTHGELKGFCRLVLNLTRGM